jgi:hypothetical protein
LKAVTRRAALRLRRLAFDLSCEPRRAFADCVRFVAPLLSLLRMDILPSSTALWRTGAHFSTASRVLILLQICRTRKVLKRAGAGFRTGRKILQNQ